MIDTRAPVTDWYGDGSVVVVDLSLACCAVESEFAIPDHATRRPDIPVGATVIAVGSGTMTHALAQRFSDTVQSLPSDTLVVAFGACACSGGPYWDSYSVASGIGHLAKVDHWIPGCPPPPAALASYVESVRAERSVDG